MGKRGPNTQKEKNSTVSPGRNQNRLLTRVEERKKKTKTLLQGPRKRGEGEKGTAATSRKNQDCHVSLGDLQRTGKKN